jgi:hypothetical protein
MSGPENHNSEILPREGYKAQEVVRIYSCCGSRAGMKWRSLMSANTLTVAPKLREA